MVKKIKFAGVMTGAAKELIDEMSTKTGIKKGVLISNAIEYYYNEVYKQNKIFQAY